MRIAAAYLGIILIWSTTPLAIKWSGEGVGFLFGATSRMVLGLCCVLTVCALRGLPLRRDRAAIKAYFAAALGIFPAMFCVYWGAQFIPSGWVAIVFGLSPMVTTILAALLLPERTLTGARIVAQLCGLAGLSVVFYSGAAAGSQALLGVAAVLLSTCFHCLSAVTIKRINTDLPAMTLVAGGLCVAVPAYLLCWYLLDGVWPATIPTHALIGILYLGVIGTTGGFVLYYFVLKHMQPAQVALVSLVSPITALMLGHVLNGEPLEARVVIGAVLVLVALGLHEWLPLRARRVASA